MLVLHLNVSWYDSQRQPIVTVDYIRCSLSVVWIADSQGRYAQNRCTEIHLWQLNSEETNTNKQLYFYQLYQCVCLAGVVQSVPVHFSQSRAASALSEWLRRCVAVWLVVWFWMSQGHCAHKGLHHQKKSISNPPNAAVVTLLRRN